jgi:hypothetical protein
MFARSKPTGSFSWACFGVLAIAVFLRFLYLDADPEYSEWAGYITDEGRWVQYARSVALHGAISETYIVDLHFFLAPLFQLIQYMVFEIAGVSFITARSLTALCGSALVVLFWVFLSRAVTPPALLLGVTLLAVQKDLVLLSRVAVPEMVVLLFQLAIYFLILSKARAPWGMLSAGFTLLVACSVKATVVLLLPVYLALIYAMPRDDAGSQRWRDLGLFATGFVVPLLMGLLVCYFVVSQETVLWLSGIRKFSSVSERFLQPTNLYGVISFPFEHSLSSVLNPWMLGPWLALLAWWACAHEHLEFELRRFLVTSGVWWALYLLLTLSLSYAPSRYTVHVLIPMAIMTTAGVSLAQGMGLERIAGFFSRREDIPAHAALAVLILPTAVFFSPLLAWIAAWFDFASGRLTTKFLCLLLVGLSTGYLARQARRNQKAMLFFLVFPLAEAGVWLVSSFFGANHAFWPVSGAASWIVAYLLKILAGLALSGALLFPLRRSPLAETSRVITVCAIFYLAVALAKDAPAYFYPRYSMRDASRDMGTLLAGYSSIASVRAETLFNENGLRYRSTGRRGWMATRPDILVVAFVDARSKSNIEKHYRLLKSYGIYVAPEYFRVNPNPRWNLGEGVVVGVYKRLEN